MQAQAQMSLPQVEDCSFLRPRPAQQRAIALLEVQASRLEAVLIFPPNFCHDLQSDGFTLKPSDFYLFRPNRSINVACSGALSPSCTTANTRAISPVSNAVTANHSPGNTSLQIKPASSNSLLGATRKGNSSSGTPYPLGTGRMSERR
jgi:hypothetical protein